jgi:predicted transcriptional regulator
VSRRKPKPGSQARRVRKMTAYTLSDETRERIDRLASVMGLSKSAVIETAVRYYDAETEPAPV